MHDNTLASLEERATERGYRDRLIGIGLALAAEGETQVIGVGSADEAATRGVDETTVFRIGSLTKLFTALAVMQLVERGLASLDDPLSRYVPSVELQTEWQNPGSQSRCATSYHIRQAYRAISTETSHSGRIRRQDGTVASPSSHKI